MNPLIRILHLEDDLADVEIVQAKLEDEGLACRITRVQTRDEFGETLRQDEYDIILADYRLPMYDGMSALHLVQELCPDVPFIFVSGTMGEEAAIKGLTKGATDYVLKQNLLRLGSAIKRALNEAENRRKRKQAQRALQESEAKMRSILENIEIGVALISPTGCASGSLPSIRVNSPSVTACSKTRRARKCATTVRPARHCRTALSMKP
jgi:DNA-binding NtrC family response regulator